jgi:DNA-binding NtrC family response regulator
MPGSLTTREHDIARDDEGPDSFRGFLLTVIDGPRAAVTWSAEGDRCSIGAHDSNDLVVQEDTVSRFHCEVVMSAEGARVRDLGSLNGTVVDGVKVVEGFLRERSVIRLGATAIRFQYRGDVQHVARSHATSFGGMMGGSPAMRATFALLERAAGSTATVLLEGETGTGKGRAAEAIHRESARRAKPFETLDCAAIPPTLLESELFGHDKGAFTGAASARAGVVEHADGGTLFLDEIGEMPLDLQPKLLRVLENRELRRVGSNQRRSVDVRVVAATNRDLRAEVNAGRFRADLYYRLAVLRITIPPLRERPEDLPSLVDTILASLGASASEAAPLRTPELHARLARAAWPGNVRELRNWVERSLVFHDARNLEEAGEPPPESSGPELPFIAAREQALRAWEKTYLEALLRDHGAKMSRAAEAAGIDRVYLYRLLKRHGLK